MAQLIEEGGRHKFAQILARTGLPQMQQVSRPHIGFLNFAPRIDYQQRLPARIKDGVEGRPNAHLVGGYGARGLLGSVRRISDGDGKLVRKMRHLPIPPKIQ